jgi:hypothetical protein
VEVGEGKGRGSGWPRRAPLKMLVKQKADAENDVGEGYQTAGTMIDTVVVIPVIVMQQNEGNQDIDASGQEQYRVVELKFHLLLDFV